jgi:ubiquinone/menaquinone biosynthesis C-methylase UbiE
MTYPIEEGIPRVLPVGYDNYTEKSFTREWAELQEEDQAWDLPVKKRKMDFLSMIALSANEVKDKILLDVGCGDGTLSSALADFGLEVVGIDITDGMKRTNEKFPDKATFIQGDATKPPFKNQSFDLMWAGGSIHHTADTSSTLFTHVPLLKPKGRFGVWLYGPRWRPSWPSEALRIFVKRLTHRQQGMLIDLIAKVVKAKQHLLMLLGIRKGKTQTPGEIKHALRDSLTVKHAHHHTCKEVKRWFLKAGFKDVVCSDTSGAVVCYGDID